MAQLLCYNNLLAAKLGCSGGGGGGGGRRKLSTAGGHQAGRPSQLSSPEVPITSSKGRSRLALPISLLGGKTWESGSTLLTAFTMPQTVPGFEQESGVPSWH